MKFEKDVINVFFASNVVVSRVGDTGEEVYEPGNVQVSTVTSRDNKGWVVSRNFARNALIFNAIVPGNVPVLAFKKEWKVRFGKVPSLSYVDKKNKPIPTVWCFKFNNDRDFEHFFGLIHVFSKLGKVVNELPPDSTISRIAAPTKVVRVVKTAHEEKFKTPTKKSYKFYPSDSSSDESVPFSSPESLAEKKIDYHFSSDEETDFGSPVFAHSQDILASLGRKPRNSAEMFSPMSASSIEN